MEELLNKLQACKEARAIQKMAPKDIVEQLKRVAAAHNATLRTLYRWLEAYEAKGPAGLMKPTQREDKGQIRSLCPAAHAYAYRLYANPAKRTATTIYHKLEARARELGPSACSKCLYCPGTEMRRKLEESGEIADYPPCTEPEKNGMKIPQSRQTLGRILSAIPTDEITMARRGLKAFKDDHMRMGVRDKPDKVNQVWVGDHHQFDCFVMDDRGRPVRPWLTAWYDAGTGCMVGWVLCTNPNTETITEAFVKAVAYTKRSPFYGLPANIYIDNGKDYRGKTFETGLVRDQDLGHLNSNISSNSVIQLFNVAVTHAQPYQGWAKTVERFFKTLEDIWIREVPGWCGGGPSERPEDFPKQLKKMEEKRMLWTMDQLYEYLQNTVFPEYHNRPHQGHGGKTPMELYQTLPRVREDQPEWEMLAVARMNMAERQITQQGIRFKNRIYWHDAMVGLAGTAATIRYSNSDLYSVTVLVGNHFLCEAGIHETMAMIGEDPEVVAAHVASQKAQIRDVKLRIYKASRPVFSDEVDTTKHGNITALEYEKASRAREEKRAQRKGKKQDPGRDIARSMFMRMGEELLKNAR